MVEVERMITEKQCDFCLHKAYKTCSSCGKDICDDHKAILYMPEKNQDVQMTGFFHPTDLMDERLLCLDCIPETIEEKEWLKKKREKEWKSGTK
jgi:hypothetical protein